MDSLIDPNKLFDKGFDTLNEKSGFFFSFWKKGMVWIYSSKIDFNYLLIFKKGNNFIKMVQFISNSLSKR